MYFVLMVKIFFLAITKKNSENNCGLCIFEVTIYHMIFQPSVIYLKRRGKLHAELSRIYLDARCNDRSKKITSNISKSNFLVTKMWA